MDQSEGNSRKSALRNGPYSASAVGPSKHARVDEDLVPKTLFGDGAGQSVPKSSNYADTPVTAIKSNIQSEGLLGKGGSAEKGSGGSGGAGGDDGGKEGSNSGKLDAGMAVLLARMESMDANLNSKFDTLQSQLSDQANEFKSELAKLRAEVVSRVQFEGLEKRVVELEAGGLASSRINWLQDQLNRLDPANKSLSFSGFISTSAAGRRANIETFLTSVMGESVPICQIEHIFKGPSGDRKMSALSLVEFLHVPSASRS